MSSTNEKGRDSTTSWLTDEESVIYREQITSQNGSGKQDTNIVVTDENIHAKPSAGKESDTALDFSIALENIRTLRCAGFFDTTVTIETVETEYTIPVSELDTNKFRSAIVENAHLTNQCPKLGIGNYGIYLCECGTCLGCAMIAVGVALSLTIIGLFVGLPIVGLGGAIVLSAFLYRKLCENEGGNVWTRRENGAETGS